jgi:indole-3-glycerol phosphate synthase
VAIATAFGPAGTWADRTIPENDIRISPEVQAFSRWSPPGGTLGTIVAEAATRAALLEADRSSLERAAFSAPSAPSLARALRSQTVTLLAEVKRRSPSKGAIAESLDAVTQARAYQQGGAAAVSILTEPRHFGGSIEDLEGVRGALTLPILKKDFHVAEIQLIEARAIGASAALLIARALAPARLNELVAFGRSIALELLVEVRDEDELERAAAAGATMIGVNNRNLESLEIDATTSERLIPRITGSLVAIAESGVRTHADVERYAACGADAVLVGSVLSASRDPVTTTRALTGVPRRPRDR